MRQVRQYDKEKNEVQEGTACGLHSQDGLQSQGGGRCRWTPGAGMPKNKSGKMVKRNKACWLLSQLDGGRHRWTVGAGTPKKETKTNNQEEHTCCLQSWNGFQ